MPPPEVQVFTPRQIARGPDEIRGQPGSLVFIYTCYPDPEGNRWFVQPGLKGTVAAMSIETLTCKLDIRGRVIELIAAIADVEVKSISDESDLSADLGIDSIDRIELAMDLEEEFDIRIQDDDIGGARTVGDVVRILEASLAAYRDPYFNA